MRPPTVERHLWILATIALFAAILRVGTGAPAIATSQAGLQAAAFSLEEATIADLQQRMQTGQETARSLAEKYLARIDAIEIRQDR
jgi:hypothetical protein